MATPLRKDRPETELTTADLARGPQANAEAAGPRPATAEGNVTEITSREDSTPLFPENELETLRRRWSEIQADFVDEPRKAVEQADNLVASAMKRLAEVFAAERTRLEQQWDRGDSISTEDLRLALQRYRSFFHRLLSV
jgi:hypothetical protein